MTRAGGAVSFWADAPERSIRAAAVGVIDDVRAGREQQLAVRDDAGLAGTVFLRRGFGDVAAHRVEVARLMVRPDRQGGGLGRALLDGAVGLAAELGFGLLVLSTRGGTALPGFYARQGWTEIGVFPGALRIGPDEYRDQHWFARPVPGQRCPGPGNSGETVGGGG